MHLCQEYILRLCFNLSLFLICSQFPINFEVCVLIKLLLYQYTIKSNMLIFVVVSTRLTASYLQYYVNYISISTKLLLKYSSEL